MISERDIWAAANILIDKYALIDKYGDAAELSASQRADELLDRGDLDEQRIWLRILEAVRQLSDTERPEDALLN